VRTREVLANAIDVVKGAALIIAFLGFIASCATWIHIWDTERGRRQSSLFVVQSTTLDSIALGLRQPSLIMVVVA
jgi:hypothetical protein